MYGLVAVPVYNEEASLPSVIRTLEISFDASTIDVIYINDGSNDSSGDILEKSGVRYISHPCNLGYVEALRTGIFYAKSRGYKFVVFFDADGQHRTDCLKKVIADYERKEADLLIGSRYLNKLQAASIGRHIGSRIFAWLIYYLGRKEKFIEDVTSGMKLFANSTYDTLLHVPLEDGHSELLLVGMINGWDIREVGIHVSNRLDGSSMYNPKKIVLYIVRVIFLIFVTLFHNFAFRK